jgi:hypothetical protein
VAAQATEEAAIQKNAATRRGGIRIPPSYRFGLEINHEGEGSMRGQHLDKKTAANGILQAAGFMDFTTRYPQDFHVLFHREPTVDGAAIVISSSDVGLQAEAGDVSAVHGIREAARQASEGEPIDATRNPGPP